MRRHPLRPIDALREGWQILLIASLPGSLLRIWGAWGATEAANEGASALFRLALWSTDHDLIARLTIPLLTAAALVLADAYRDYLPDVGIAIRPAAAPPPARAVRLDAMTAPAPRWWQPAPAPTTIASSTTPRTAR